MRGTAGKRWCQVFPEKAPEPLAIDGVMTIPLINRLGEIVGETTVDAGDYEFLAQYSWHLTSTGYAGASGRFVDDTPATDLRLHRLLLGTVRDGSLFGDHINRQRLDNRRANLRIVDRQANFENRSATHGSSSLLRGVTRRRDGRFQAVVVIRGEKHHLGTFACEADAGRAASEFRAVHMPGAVEMPS